MTAAGEGATRGEAVLRAARRLGAPTALAECSRRPAAGRAALGPLWEALVVEGLLPAELSPADPVWLRHHGPVPAGRGRGCASAAEAAALAAHWPAVSAAAATAGELAAAREAWAFEPAPPPDGPLPILLSVEASPGPVSAEEYGLVPGLRRLIAPAERAAAAALRDVGEVVPSLGEFGRPAPGGRTVAEWQAVHVGLAAETLRRAREAGLRVPPPHPAVAFDGLPDPVRVLAQWIAWGLVVVPGPRAAPAVAFPEAGAAAAP